MSREFWRDFAMEEIISDIRSIFELEGVELVRLSGLLNRERKILEQLSPEILNNIIMKLKNGGVINYKFIINCPHCQEISYQIKDIDITKPKLCDTCSVFYHLIGNIKE